MSPGGCYSILLGEQCFIVEIRSDYGVMYFIFREGSILAVTINFAGIYREISRMRGFWARTRALLYAHKPKS